MKQRNYSLDVIRLVMALIVVVCHVDFAVEGNYIFHQFVARFSPRIAVSFFFAMSGYYYIKSIEKPGIFKKQLKSLLTVYIAWTLIYYAASFVDNIILGDGDLVQFLLQRVLFFFTEGSYSHFWFFTAMIYSVILATLFFKWMGKKGITLLTVLSLVLFAIGNLGSSYYAIGEHIPVLNVLYGEYSEVFFVLRGILCMGLPYFMMGYFINLLEEKILNMDLKKYLVLYGVGSVLYVAEIVMIALLERGTERPEVFVMLYPMTFLLFGLLLRNPMPKWEKVAPFCKRMSSFIYYVHPLLILIFGIGAGFLNVAIPSYIMYVLVIGTAWFCGLVLFELGEKIKFLKYLG